MRLECLMTTTPLIFKEVSLFEIALKGGNSKFEDLSSFFDPGDITVVRVPGRLDVMGGIADYSGANVCEGTLERGVALGVQIRDDDKIRIRSLGMNNYNLETDFTCSLESLYCDGEFCSYEKMQQLLQHDQATSWAAYIMGTIFVLLRENIISKLTHGLNLAIISRVPIQVGIGSSATVEIATLHALNALLGLGLDGLGISRLGQLTENRVVGAPCGIMDQITVACGQTDSLTHILCQPDIIKSNIPIPEDYEFVGINSMVHHSVAGPNYRNVRIATFMGRKIISLEMQKQKRLPEGQLLDYVCNISPEEFENDYRNLLPESITGAEFLEKYGESGDSVTRVDPNMTYFVRSRTAHPIYENDRVLKFIDLLNKTNAESNEAYMKQVGRLMMASHESYQRNCDLSCPEVDQLVEIVKEVGKKYHVYGAKITGGGSGGTVAVIGKKKYLHEATVKIAQKYEEATKLTPDVFWGSSPGALSYGNRKYRLYP